MRLRANRSFCLARNLTLFVERFQQGCGTQTDEMKQLMKIQLTIFLCALDQQVCILVLALHPHYHSAFINNKLI